MSHFWCGFEKRAERFEFKSPEEIEQEKNEPARSILPGAAGLAAGGYGGVQGASLAEHLMSRYAINSEDMKKSLKGLTKKEKKKLLDTMSELINLQFRRGLKHPIDKANLLGSHLANEFITDTDLTKWVPKSTRKKLPKMVLNRLKKIPAGTGFTAGTGLGAGPGVARKLGLLAGGSLGAGLLGYGAYKGVRGLQDVVSEKMAEENNVPEMAGGIGGMMLGTELARKAGHGHHGAIPIALLTGLGGASMARALIGKKKTNKE